MAGRGGGGGRARGRGSSRGRGALRCIGDIVTDDASSQARIDELEAENSKLRVRVTCDQMLKILPRQQKKRLQLFTTD